MDSSKRNRYFDKYTIIFPICFTVTVVRLLWNFLFGFRWPSAWVLTSNVFTYDSGFMPRAFVASVLKLFVGNHIYSLKFLYILIIGTNMLIFAFLIYMSYYYNIKTRNIIGGIIILWYSLSIYSAYLSYEAGYFEQYGYVLLFLLLLLPIKIKNPMAFSIICTVTNFIILLISETNAFLVCPILFFASLLRLYNDDKKGLNLGFLKKLVILILMNIPCLIYCFHVGSTLIPESTILNQINMIRSHANYFERLDEIGGYFYKGRIPGYASNIEFKVWNWQLKLYLFLIVSVVAMILYSIGYYRKVICYIGSCIFILALIYCLNFIAWDTDRFKFCAATAITFFSMWIVKEIDIRRIVLRKDVVYVCIIGTMLLIMIMDYRLELFDGAMWNNSYGQFKENLQSTWRITY